MKAAEYFNGTFEDLPELTAQEADQLKELFYKYQSLSPEDMFYFAAIAKLFINDRQPPGAGFEANNRIRDIENLASSKGERVQGVTIGGVIYPILSDHYQVMLYEQIRNLLFESRFLLAPLPGEEQPPTLPAIPNNRRTSAYNDNLRFIIIAVMQYLKDSGINDSDSRLLTGLMIGIFSKDWKTPPEKNQKRFYKDKFTNLFKKE